LEEALVGKRLELKGLGALADTRERVTVRLPCNLVDQTLKGRLAALVDSKVVQVRFIWTPELSRTRFDQHTRECFGRGFGKQGHGALVY
jgi:hypothetical protein